MIKLKDVMDKYWAIKKKQEDDDNIDFDTTEKEYDIEGENLKDFLNACFTELSQLFADIGYVPYTLNEANQVLLSYLNLDSKKEITASFAKSFLHPDKKTTLKINKNNFYIGYHTKVWASLSVSERAQIVKWHIDNKKEQVKYNKITLRLVIPKEYSFDYEMCGMFDSDEHTLYINPTFLFQNDSIRLEHTIEHEFEHIKQSKLINYLKQKKLDKNNLFEKYVMERFGNDYIYINNATLDQTDLLYFADPIEQAAELRGIKNIEKYMKDPLYSSLYDKFEKSKFEHYKSKVYYHNFIYTPAQAKKALDLSDKDVEQYKKERRFVKQMPTICKLILLRDNVIGVVIEELNEKYYQFLQDYKEIEDKLFRNYETEKDVLLEEKTLIKKSMKRIEERIKVLQTRTNLIDDYLQDIINGKTPKLSDDFFCELNLMEK